MKTAAYSTLEKQHLAAPEVVCGDEVDTAPDYRTAAFIKEESLLEGLQALDTPDALYELLNESRDLPAWDVKLITNAGRIQDILLRQIETYTQGIEKFKGGI